MMIIIKQRERWMEASSDIERGREGRREGRYIDRHSDEEDWERERLPSFLPLLQPTDRLTHLPLRPMYKASTRGSVVNLYNSSYAWDEKREKSSGSGGWMDGLPPPFPIRRYLPDYYPVQTHDWRCTPSPIYTYIHAHQYWYGQSIVYLLTERLSIYLLI